MKFTARFDIWTMPVSQLRTIQPGQHVYAGDRSTLGVFLGVKPSGSVVVAWKGNMQAHTSQRGYIRTLRNYAKGN